MKVQEKPEGHGFDLEFENGHKYYVVDLSKILQATMLNLPAESQEFRQAYIEADEKIGKLYDEKYGGRFEALMLSHRQEFGYKEGPVIFHGTSFNEVIAKVEKFENMHVCKYCPKKKGAEQETPRP